jgi:hypothetical protein
VFEYVTPLSSTPVVLSRPHQRPQSSGVAALMAQQTQDEDQDNHLDTNDNDNDDNDEFLDINTLDLDEFVEPQPRVSTTQMGIRRLEADSDTYLPGTLLPHLYQTNPFSRQHSDEELGGFVHELTAKVMAPTEQEIRDMAEEDEDDQVLSQAIEAFVAPTRAGRKRTATFKVVDNAVQARDAKRAKTSNGGQK